MLRENFGVVVPTPTLPKKYDEAEVVAMILPTVSWVPVAMIVPELLVVRIEFGENEAAATTCEARVEVETVETKPFEPMNE